VLSEAGYEVSTDYREGMKSVLTFTPDGVILGANPPQLDCCDLLSEISAPSVLRTYACWWSLRADPVSALGGWILVLMTYSVATSTKGDPKQVMEELARCHLIRRLVT
jgi:hypothetical protein